MAGLYIHVPFCKSKCAYCDFYSQTNIVKRAGEYVEAIKQEFMLRKAEIGPVQTVYIGGGTPSALPIEAQVELLDFINANTRDLKEFTIEVNPDDIDEPITRLWHEKGISRVSMGVQSFNDSELKAVGRRHSGSRAIDAFHTLRQYFNNISVDLIIGLPSQTIESLAHSLDTLLTLCPEHISAYILSYEEGTALFNLKKNGTITPHSEDVIITMYRYVCDTLRNAGYEHYEISNFCKPGFRAIHNHNYWNGVDYLGLGPGAYSCASDNIRRYNPRDFNRWSNRLTQGIADALVETESDVDRVNDYIMVRLRTADGLDLNHRIVKPFHNQIINNYQRIVSKYKNAPHEMPILKDSTRLFIPEEQWLVSDGTIASMFV